MEFLGGKKMSLSSVSQSNAPWPLFTGLVTSREASQQEHMSGSHLLYVMSVFGDFPLLVSHLWAVFCSPLPSEPNTARRLPKLSNLPFLFPLNHLSCD